MKKQTYIKIGLPVILSVFSFQYSRSQEKDIDLYPTEKGKYEATWESLSEWECPEWFKDAKFGIWAHWGPQCQAESGDWYARGMYFDGHWQNEFHKKHFGDPAQYGLKELCNDWKADQWNPDSLVALYKSVGAKYFFTLGQHHDNFDLWNSPYQEWNSVNVGPRRDIIKEWASACEKNDLPLGISMHGSHTWTFLEIAQAYDGNLTAEDGVGKWWEGLDPQELYAQNHTPSPGWEIDGSIHSQWDWENCSQPSEYFKTKFRNRVLQCIDTYNPDMIYFDDTVLPFYGCDEQVGLDIVAHYYNHSANQQDNSTAQVVVMGKQLKDNHKKSLLWDVERGIPNDIQEKYWQTCTCIGSWHYDRGIYERGDYKDASYVIAMLADIVSKNGNLLLSVPIRGNGTIDDKEVKVLEGIRDWMNINSESIYGTRPWIVFGEGPNSETESELKAQGFNESNNYTNKDVRYVSKDGKVYATILKWPDENSFLFKSLAENPGIGKVSVVKLLGAEENIDFNQTDKGLQITIPEQRPNPIAPVFEITFD